MQNHGISIVEKPIGSTGIYKACTNVVESKIIAAHGCKAPRPSGHPKQVLCQPCKECTKQLCHCELFRTLLTNKDPEKDAMVWEWVAGQKKKKAADLSKYKYDCFCIG